MWENEAIRIDEQQSQERRQGDEDLECEPDEEGEQERKKADVPKRGQRVERKKVGYWGVYFYMCGNKGSAFRITAHANDG